MLDVMEQKQIESPLKTLLNKPSTLLSPTYSHIGTPKVRLRSQINNDRYFLMSVFEVKIFLFIVCFSASR